MTSRHRTQDELTYTTFLLIRHAQARSVDGTYGPNTPLSELGRKQASLLAKALDHDREIAAVYSSPFPRALQTAEALCMRLGRQAITSTDLREFEVAEQPLKTIEYRADLEIWRPEHQGASNGETVEAFFRRVGGFCDQLCNQHPNETILLVTHAGTIDAVYRWGIGFKPSEPWQFELDIGNASVTELEVWPKGRIPNGAPKHCVLRRVGDARHLESNVSQI